MYQSKRILKDKGLIIMSVISLLAIIGLVVGVMISDRRSSNNNDNVVTLAEDSTETNTQKTDGKVTKETTTAETNTMKTEEFSETINSEDKEMASENTQATPENTASETISTETTEESTTADNTSVNAPASQLSFTNESILLWPVETNDIIIDFSMDTTTYFATLDMYKTSDAVCIRSDLGSPVYASADGAVINNSYNEEIGHFIVMDLGNSYELTYGQLKDIQVDEGDTLKKGDLIGYISEPTKYYTVEGANLYLKLTSGGVPTDPLDYLDFE